MRYFLFTFIFALTIMHETLGQAQLPRQITPDSIVKKLHIRQVTENWFTGVGDDHPANTTYELFDESGNRIQRVHINYFYHKFINNYSYDRKKGVVVDKEEYYDWNPYREKNKGDTVLKKSRHKYPVAAKKDAKSKAAGINEFSSGRIYDTEGKLIQQTDSIKFMYETTYYTYNNNGQLNEKKQFISRFSEKPQLNRIDSFFYNTNSTLISKEINYFDIKTTGDKIIYDRVVERRYTYNVQGLVIEKEVEEKYLSLNRSSKPSFYKYEYRFF